MQKVVGILFAIVLLVACKKSKDKAEEPTAIVSDREELMLLGLANQEDSFRITTNRSWKITVEPAANWLQLNASAGRGDFTIKMKHLNDATQEAKVTLTISDVTKQVADKKVVINRQPFYIAPAVKMVGGTREDIFNKAYPTSDGGFIVVGSTKSYDGDMDFRQGPEVDFTDGLVIKFSSSGTIEWKRAYGGNNHDAFNTVVEVPGAGYILAGHSFSNNGDFATQHGFSDTWVMKIDYDGNKIWSKLFGGTSHETINSTIVAGQNEVIAVGHSYSNDGDFINVRGNTMRNALWMKVFMNGELAIAKGLENTSQANYDLNGISQGAGSSFMLSGTAPGGIHGALMLTSINPSGITSWKKTFNYGGIMAHLSLPDGGVFSVGTTPNTSEVADIQSKSGGYDGFVLRTSPEGNKLWYNAYGGSALDLFNSIVQIPSIGYLLAGLTWSNDGQVRDFKGAIDGWVVLVDETGKLLWSKTVGGNKDDYFKDMIRLKNKRTVLIGNSNSTGGGMRALGDTDGFVWMFE